MLPSIVGFASYVTMIDPDKGKPLLARARAVARRHGWVATKKPAPSLPLVPTRAGAEVEHGVAAFMREPKKAAAETAPPAAVPEPVPNKKWWQIF